MIGLSGVMASRPDNEHAVPTGKDVALALVSNDVALEIDPTVEKRVLRKIDLFFMPAMLIGESFRRITFCVGLG